MLSHDLMLQLYNDGDQAAGDWLWRELTECEAPWPLALTAFVRIVATERLDGRGDRRGSQQARRAISIRNIDRIEAADEADTLIAKGLYRSDEDHGAFGVAGNRHSYSGRTVRDAHRTYCRPMEETVTDIHIAAAGPSPQNPPEQVTEEDDDEIQTGRTGKRDEAAA